MPIFTQSLRTVHAANPAEAIKEMANHIRYIQEQLEYTLMNLDSSNIISIDTDDTDLSGSSIEAISELTRTVNAVATAVSVQSGNISTLQQTVGNQSEDISALERTVAEQGQTLNGKLTANKVAAQAAVAADADAAAIAAGLNSLIAAMKSSGVMNT